MTLQVERIAEVEPLDPSVVVGDELHARGVEFRFIPGFGNITNPNHLAYKVNGEILRSHRQLIDTQIWEDTSDLTRGALEFGPEDWRYGGALFLPYRSLLDMRFIIEDSLGHVAGGLVKVNFLRLYPFQSAMSMLNFYINRAGKKLPEERKQVLTQAKLELKRLFGKQSQKRQTGSDKA